jgi:ligand-binding SRPBCC domain-containing protein
MPKIELETEINAPVERVFDLALSIDLHAETMGKYGEKAVAGVTSGLIKLDETVTWEAVHFGFRQRLTSKITKFDRPHFFQDAMVKGAFKRFTHDHFFTEKASGTLLKDVFDYESPLRFLGQMADAMFLKKYMTRLLAERNELIKRTAEGGGWQKFIS